ncbi:MAG: 16S rRNA (uracil(1498)-N(3))-methyltransferase [Desulfotalea sp.]|nr:MAG: 16S rRNA (uracil(1498)-N(3))-methyltransferase [Desulfotalea sp.]
MNIILVQAKEIQGNCVHLCDHRAEHIVKVLRADVGTRVKVGCIDGPLGTGDIVSINKKYPFQVELKVDLFDNQRPEAHLDLILALPRPIMLKRILSQVTALGVGTIHLVNAKRVEKSFWGASILEPMEYRKHLLQGLEQAVDSRVPRVVIHEKFKPFIEDFLPTIIRDYASRICAHPTGDMKLGEVITPKKGRVLLAIGPEGGWVDYEVEKFQDQQFSCCTIGDRILKVDTAVIALHSQITALRDILPIEM